MDYAELGRRTGVDDYDDGRKEVAYEEQWKAGRKQ